MGATVPSTSPLVARLREVAAGGRQGAPASEAARVLNELIPTFAGESLAAPVPAGESAAPIDEMFELLAAGRFDAAIREGLDLELYNALGERLAEAVSGAEAGTTSGRQLTRRAWAWLDAVRRPALLARVADGGAQERWIDLIHRLIVASRFTVARLLEQRVERYGPRALFRVREGGKDVVRSWLEVETTVAQLARGFLALVDEHGRSPIAILSENSYPMALTDLACLSSGLVNLMIPAPTTGADVAYILRQAKAGMIVVSSEQQLQKVERHRAELPDLKVVIMLGEQPADATGLLCLAEVMARGKALSRERLARARDSVEMDALATLMYTSGTTGKPKGIAFSQTNMVVKRFARALALPQIGDEDVFLCYLPLFHTFGRYLELLGTIFWGATYVFLEDPSIDTLRESMRRDRPTVFISVPKKWMELWEEIGRRADLEEDPDDVLLQATREVVGDRLRVGLSAAGYLAPEIFRFFQRQGIDLMSGFGMTEATGGITMTPPGRYRDDTLGVALPGIEVRLDESGEMMIRGPYVMTGYFESSEGSGLDAAGWLRTGDLMEQDEAGYYRLVDRKKEIYKNTRGESIAPQRVENLFRDFEAVKRVFLVGDHRPYNTVLFVPNPDCQEVDLAAMDREAKRDYFRSLIVSVNRFLSPFERIVDFAILDRDFEEAREELTPKGTYRRNVVAKNFAPVIETLYRRVQLKAPGLGVEIHVPNWFFQRLGLTTEDVRFEDHHLVLTSTGASLTVKALSRTADGEIAQIGSSRYLVRRRAVDLGSLVASPALWLGNEELVRFAPFDEEARTRRVRPPRDLILLGQVEAYGPVESELEVLRRAVGHPAPALEELHLAARVLGSAEEKHGLLGLRVIAQALRSEEGTKVEMARLALHLATDSKSVAVRRRAFQILLPEETDAHTPDTLARFLSGPDQILDAGTIASLSEKGLSGAKITALVRYTESLATRTGDLESVNRAGSLLQFLAEYGAAHPARFKELRMALARVQVFADQEEVREEASRALERLTEGFRAWLGPVQRIAVDPEDGEEYRWEDVITFEEGLDDGDRARILEALSRTSVLRESVFLFSGEALLRLADLPPGGIWVSLLGKKHGKAVYRVTAHTRLQGSFDLALNLNRDQTPEELAAETSWLLVTGETEERGPLVEEFGGYWQEFDLWSEEFIAGETLERAVNRLARHRDGEPVDRLRLLWPFFVWCAAGAFIEFWVRTGRRYVLAEPSPGDVIVPTHDYQTGTRVVSISEHGPAPGVGAMLNDLWTHLVGPIEAEHPALDGVVSAEVILSAFLEVVGVDEGLALLAEAAALDGPVTKHIRDYADKVKATGFLPRRLHSAIERYHRWAALAPDAPPQAQAKTVSELYETYRLADLMADYPDVRVRFFRETVLRDCPMALVRGLDQILERLRQRDLDAEELVERLADLRVHIQPGSPEEYFLARLTYPHLRPGDEAGFLYTEMGGVRQSDIVVLLEDHGGRPYRVRQPVNPKEVGRLHRLFLEANLDVQFRPEHQYLVAVSERGIIIGGIFYETDEENRSAHLEKIVVAERYRKLGVGDGLMNEFFNRLRAAGLRTVTTGFFRPSYFYRFGFRIGKRQAGLVNTL